VSCALPACLIDLRDVKPAMPFSLHSACLTALAEPNQAAAAALGFKHLLHLGVLAEEVVDLLDGGARASGDALAAAAVDEFVVAAPAGGQARIPQPASMCECIGYQDRSGGGPTLDKCIHLFSAIDADLAETFERVLENQSPNMQLSQ
jgi:hypothetical protein